VTISRNISNFFRRNNRADPLVPAPVASFNRSLREGEERLAITQLGDTQGMETRPPGSLRSMPTRSTDESNVSRASAQ
jgi:hypothetical protein